MLGRDIINGPQGFPLVSTHLQVSPSRCGRAVASSRNSWPVSGDMEPVAAAVEQSRTIQNLNIKQQCWGWGLFRAASGA